MAAAQKSTGLQIALAIVSALFLVVGIVAYMQAKNRAEAQSAATAADAAAQDANNKFTKLSEEVEALKKDLGYDGAKEVGLGDPAPEGSVRGMLAKDLGVLGPTPAQPNLAAALMQMNGLIATANTDLAANKDALVDTNARLLAAEAAYRNESQQLQKSADDSETQKQQLITTVGEQLKMKDDEITKLQSQVRTLDGEKANIADELNKVRSEKDEEIGLLERRIDQLVAQLDDYVRPTFERPDGQIVRVDYTPPGTVWINLGELAGLRKGVTFSIYSQGNQGVGRDLDEVVAAGIRRRSDDIKASIEVVEILGPNLASARILSQKLDNPIHAGDPIYSPAWTAGQTEYFSFVGIIDLDNDGLSDRELLHEILKTNNAEVEIEVNDEGELNREDARLTVNSKFLVIGNIPDPSSFAGFDEKQAQAKKIQDQLSKLTDEARKQGIRDVSLRDFLSFMGYKPQQSVYQPGKNRLQPSGTSSPSSQQ